MNKIYLIITSLLFTGSLISQTTGKISGIVKDADTDEPLIAANVMFKELPLALQLTWMAPITLLTLNQALIQYW